LTISPPAKANTPPLKHWHSDTAPKQLAALRLSICRAISELYHLRHGASTAFIILITITNKQKTQHTNRTQTIDGERMERLVLANTDSQHSSSSTTHSKCWSVATRSLFLKYPTMRFSSSEYTNVPHACISPVHSFTVSAPPVGVELGR